MSKKNTAAIAFVNPLAAATEKVKAAENALAAFLQKHKAARRADWIAAGGCERCGGTGTVYQRDQSGQADYDPCTYLAGEGFVCTAKTVGMPAGADVREAYDKNVTAWIPHTQDIFHKHHGRIHGAEVGDPRHTWPPVAPLLQDPADVAELQTLREDLDLALDVQRPLVDLWRVTAGCRMIALRDFTAKGVEITAGTQGAIVWAQTTTHHDHRYGGGTETTTRVAFVPDGKKDAVFVDVDGRLAVSEPADDAALPILVGTEKQVSWARKLRMTAIDNGAVPDDVVKRENMARFWIDNRALWGNAMGGVPA